MSGILVTGAAGFIGFHACRALLARGERVIGIDSLNDYYDPALKRARLDLLASSRFTFHAADIATDEIAPLLAGEKIAAILHLGAYAGVRLSLTRPDLYLRNNILGQQGILGLARILEVGHIVYASSSSVYGAAKPPFREDGTLLPLSPYAASKQAAEILSATYTRLYGIRQTGLRFFTVYGPWGRPDMAYYLFAQAIDRGEILTLYGDGSAQRDFTYVDDIVVGILSAMERGPQREEAHRIYNLGNDRPEKISALIAALERHLGKPARITRRSPLAGEAQVTWADIDRARRELGYEPRTRLEEGIGKFVAWYRSRNA
ncbi:MAG TPA: NAD-dependent epimerase/dehydratase family protein [Dongiaceae bacterium]|jgi:UDP-glucuronate 4-epimerase|nr:NAD-dependent epimerase/dehydratase family protein [Dongiaceae bacterium]